MATTNGILAPNAGIDKSNSKGTKLSCILMNQINLLKIKRKIFLN